MQLFLVNKTFLKNNFMAQIQKGDTFADGQQVTGARLNQLVDSATILPNIISDQQILGVLSSDDKLLVYQNSEGELKQADVSNVLNSNIPITVSEINSQQFSELKLTPSYLQVSASSVAFTTFNSNKIVVVGNNSYGLEAGQFVQIYGSSDSAYNGNFVITYSNGSMFQYNVLVAGTAGSGTLNYSTNNDMFATLFIKGNESVIGNQYISSGSYIGSDSVVGGNSYVIGNQTITGNLTVTGTTTANLTTTSTAVTQTSTDNSTKIATTAFVKSNPAICKAWAKIVGNNSTSITAGYNVASVSYSTSPQRWNVVFTNPMADANYVINGTASWSVGLDGNITAFVNIYSQSTTGFSFSIMSPAGYGGGHLETQASFVYLTVFGN